jgi:transposase
VTFRWATDKKLRKALCDFAGDNWRANTWAETRYRQLRADGRRHPHAERILPRSWAQIIWRC